MFKTIDPMGWDWRGEPTLSVVKISSRGLRGNDLQAFRKRASDDLMRKIAASELFPDELMVHGLAVGDYETTGANRKGDAFDRHTCRTRHHTFKKYAKWYRNHEDSDPNNSFGRIAASDYNESMGRIELLAGLNTNKTAADRNDGKIATLEMSKLASGDILPISMGCYIDPDFPILTAEGYKRIADIKIGDLVWTHQQRWRPVTEINRRRYSGEVVTWRMQGLPIPVAITGDHPMFSKLLTEYAVTKGGKRQASRWLKQLEKTGGDPFTWNHATHLEKNDVVASAPITSGPDNVKLDDVRLCELLGLYAAEGSLNYNGDKACTVEYTVNVADWAVKGVPAIVKDLWPEQHVGIAPKKSSTAALALRISSTALAEWCRCLIGAGVAQKRVPLALFNSDISCKAAFMGRWLDGDGWCDQKGIHWSSANLHLILGGRDLLLSMGIPSTIYKINHRRDGTTEYTLNVSNLDTVLLQSFSEKAASNCYIRSGSRTKPASMRRVGSLFSYRVKKVTRHEVTDVVVYNFEVKDDESYSAAGLVSHNCRVAYDVCTCCGNKAKTADDYCDESNCPAGGCKNYLGKLRKQGNDLKHVGVFNPGCYFVDISTVHRPAGRTCYAYLADSMKKAASDMDDKRIVGSAETARSLGLLGPTWLVTGDNPESIVRSKMASAIDRVRNATIGGVMVSQWDCELADLTKHVTAADAPAQLAALAEAGILVNLSDFAAINNASAYAASARGLVGQFYKRAMETADYYSIKEDRWANAVPCESWKMTDLIAKTASELGLETGFKTRAIRSSVSASKPNLPVGPDSPGGRKLAADYVDYRLSALSRYLPNAVDDMLTLKCAIMQDR